MKYPVLECEYCGNLYYEVQAECSGCGSRRLRQKEYLRDEGKQERWYLPFSTDNSLVAWSHELRYPPLTTAASCVAELVNMGYSPSEAELIFGASNAHR
jgi:ribosomal protein L37E